MKNPVEIIKKDGKKYAIYPRGTELINGFPVITTDWEDFICSNCKYFGCEKESIVCDQHQINGGKKVTGTSVGCEKFVLREK